MRCSVARWMMREIHGSIHSVNLWCERTFGGLAACFGDPPVEGRDWVEGGLGYHVTGRL